MAKLHGAKKAAFLRRMAAGRRKKSASKSRKSSTHKRKTRQTKSMPRRKTHRRRASVSSGFRRTKAGIGSIFKKGLVGKVVIGIGAGTVAGIALNAIAPQFSGIGKVGAAFLAGGPIGGIAQLVVGGGLGNLGGLFGGSGPTTESSL